MKFKPFLLVALLSLMLAVPVSAEYFRYVDENGFLCFTDDVSKIQNKRLNQITSYESVKPNKTTRKSYQQNLTEPKKNSHHDLYTWDKELQTQSESLKDEKKQLNATFQQLAEEKKQLQKKLTYSMTKTELKRHQKNIRKLNKKIDNYQKACQNFKNRVQRFNTEAFNFNSQI
jgi:predicted RNase H-like nuclease (RuvC/YqgF family)